MTTHPMTIEQLCHLVSATLDQSPKSALVPMLDDAEITSCSIIERDGATLLRVGSSSSYITFDRLISATQEYAYISRTYIDGRYGEDRRLADIKTGRKYRIWFAPRNTELPIRAVAAMFGIDTSRELDEGTLEDGSKICEIDLQELFRALTACAADSLDSRILAYIADRPITSAQVEGESAPASIEVHCAHDQWESFANGIHGHSAFGYTHAINLEGYIFDDPGEHEDEDDEGYWIAFRPVDTSVPFHVVQALVARV